MDFIPVPLGIDELKISKIEQNENDVLIITVKSSVRHTSCKKCGKKITKLHSYGNELVIRHLPILDNEVYLKIKPVRYICESCDKTPTTTETLGWCNLNTKTTKQYDKYIMRSLIGSTILDVTKKENISYDKTESILNNNIDSGINWDEYSNIDILGLDEISLKKGHKDFVVIVSCRIKGKTNIITILEDRTKETVKNFLLTIPNNIKKNIKSICTDMYDSFVNAATEVFKNKGIIVVDRFHVAKLYRNVLDDTRKKELKRLKQELSKAEYEQLKGSMWALRKKPTEISEDEEKTLTLLFKYSSLLFTIYNLINELTNIFEDNLKFRAANKKINKWILTSKKMNNNALNKFITTLRKYKHNILNYFKNRKTSGFVEGLNNKIKVIKRRCYGIFVIENLYKRIYLDLNGYGVYA